MKKILFCLVFVILITATCITAISADSDITFINRDSGIAFTPGSKLSSSDLFPNFKNLMPGDSVTQKIIVKNQGDSNFKSMIYMRALGAHDESEEFLSKLKLTVSIGDDNSYLFNASANETASLTEWTLLGTLYHGNSMELDVKLEIPNTLDSTYENAIGYLDWEFKVEELRVVDPEPQKEVQVQIVWVDENDQEGKRPEKVTVTLILDNNTEKNAEIRAEDGWKYTFTDIDANVNVSSIKQSEIGEYTTSYSGDEKNGFVITNTLIKPEDPDDPTPDDPTPDDPTPDDPTPPTGDTSSASMWTKIAIISFTVTAFVLILLIITRKKNNETN